ncbi:hypothetical protein D9615_001988 [Tricholomella constricta]|uniref:Uncharacterized protein n=1 Tax=Tricholomella constricta TaxID=117010 RepID=A0A8H5HPI0_9AGAR|nr:hypothetical protein D9615_001988 [Tricholomella constricta]
MSLTSGSSLTMEPLRKLRDLIAKVDYNNLTKQDHREIYQYIEREVLSPKSPIIKQVPPLELIVYSIQNILLPKLATRRIPDLLDLLATVEFYRKRTMDHARDAIVWNDYYKNEKTIITLTAEEEGFLKNLEKQEKSLREMYIVILTDMYLLWTASPPSMTDFLIRFNEYFPFLNDHCERVSPRLFHSDLSTTEIAQLEDVGLKCCDTAQGTVAWAMDQTIHHAFRMEDFKEAFPRPCGDNHLQEMITYFADHVMSAAKKIQEIFGDS